MAEPQTSYADRKARRREAYETKRVDEHERRLRQLEKQGQRVWVMAQAALVASQGQSR